MNRENNNLLTLKDISKLTSENKYKFIFSGLFVYALFFYLSLAFNKESYRSEIIVERFSALSSNQSGSNQLIPFLQLPGQSKSISTSIAKIKSSDFLTFFYTRNEDAFLALGIKASSEATNIVRRGFSGYQDGELIFFELSTSNPEWSGLILNFLIDDFNTYISEKNINKSKDSIDYLKYELAAEDNLEIRKIISNVIQSEFSKISLEKVSGADGFDVIEPAYTPTRMENLPNTILWLLFLPLTALIVYFFTFVLIFLRKQFET
jgi:hypothetical protein